MNAISRTAIEEVLPLTPTQLGMLLDVLRGDARAGTYIGVIAFEISGAATPVRIEEALHATVLRHPALRAGFLWRDLKTPLQAIHTSAHLPVAHDDWSSESHEACRDRKTALIASERCRVFDLERPPLMAARIIARAPDRYLVVWTIHHLLADGWSAGVLVRDVLDHLGGQGKQIDTGLKRYLGWQKRRDRTAEDPFWRDYLAGISPVRALSFGPVQSSDIADPQSVSIVPVPAELARAAQDCARGLRMTYPTLLSAIFALCLRRYGAGDDVVFGLSSAGRPSQVEGMGGAVGAFVTTHPVRTRIDAAQPVRTYLAQFSTMLQRQAGHTHTPLPDVLAACGLSKGRDLFEAIFVYEGLPQSRPAGEHALSALDIVAASDEPLTLAYLPGDAPHLHLYHDPGRFDGAGVQAFARDFLHLLSAASRAPDTLLSKLALRPAWEGPAPHDSIFVPDLICQIAQATPDAVALVSGDTTLTYATLLSAADAVAADLIKRGVGAGDIVPVAALRGARAVIGMLGVMRAGAAYVPLDLEYPQARLDQIIEAVSPKIIVTDTANLARFEGCAVLCTDAATPDPAFQPPVLKGCDLAYVLFTSGSTGQPKGVMITHANLAYSTASRQTVYPAAPRSFLVLSSFAADSSVVGLYWTLTTGGTLVVSAPDLARDPKRIGQLIAQAQVDHMLCLPDLYRLILSARAPADLSSLRCVILAGDTLGLDLITEHRGVLPTCRLYNEYGPTEATVWCAAYDASAHEDGPVSIGQPPHGTRLWVTDPDGAPLPDGVEGEIVVSGAGVFAGYLNDPAKTTAALHDDRVAGYRTGDVGRVDPAGNVMFLGRRDDQIKVRGHRVEPAEIEAVLRAQAGVEQACVVACGDPDPKLVACVTGGGDVQALRQAVNAALPAFMALSNVITLKALPSLPNGKTDRATLAAQAVVPQAKPTSARVPESFVAQKLAAIWSGILGHAPVNLDDDFFAIGGDSLKAMRLSVAAAKVGLHFAPHEVFAVRTLEGLAALVTQQGAQGVGTPDAHLMQTVHPQARAGHFVMVHGSTQVCARLASTLGPDRTLAFQYAPYQLAAPLPRDIPAMARDLAARIKADHPEGPFYIGGYSVGAVVAVELAQLLTEQGETVRYTCLVDPSWSTGYLGKTAGGTRVVQRIITRLRVAGISVLSDFRRLRAAAKLMRDADNLPAREAHTGNRFRKMLLHHTPRRYDGPVTVMLSRQGKVLADPASWLMQACPAARVEDLDYDHLDLQTDSDAIFAWTTRLTEGLGRAERGEAP